jgi:hypothetical protein
MGSLDGFVTLLPLTYDIYPHGEDR